MALEIDLQNDFAQILDGGEAITLHRRGGSSTIAIVAARRFSAVASALDGAGGNGRQHDVVWQFPWPTSVELPRLGDTLTDAQDHCWTILQVEEKAANTRLRCHARELRIAHGLDSLVDIELAQWDDLGGGPEIVGWQLLRPAVAARIQPERTTVDNEADPPTSIATYRITLGESLELDHNHRFVGTDGTIYQLVEYSNAERIDALPAAIVTRVTSSA